MREASGVNRIAGGKKRTHVEPSPANICVILNRRLEKNGELL